MVKIAKCSRHAHFFNTLVIFMCHSAVKTGKKYKAARTENGDNKKEVSGVGGNKSKKVNDAWN